MYGVILHVPGYNLDVPAFGPLVEDKMPENVEQGARI